MGYWSEAFSNLIGKTDKAIIVIQKKEANDNKVKGKQVLNVSSLKEIGSFKKKGGKGGDAFSFGVQYNPSKLDFNSFGGVITRRRGAAENLEKFDNKYEPTVQLSLELVFQDVNDVDAFGHSGMDKALNFLGGGISLSNMIKAGLSVAETYSVQDQIETFLAIITNEETDNISFLWEDMAFTGKLETVNSRYVMFSPSGKPIAGVVDLIMVNRAETSTEWTRKFDDLFKIKVTDTSDKLVAIPRSDPFLGNLLN